MQKNWFPTRQYLLELFFAELFALHPLSTQHLLAFSLFSSPRSQSEQSALLRPAGDGITIVLLE